MTKRKTNLKKAAGVKRRQAAPRGPVEPPWLSAQAGRIWKKKVANYKKREINIAGLEGPLALYCSLEASLIDTYSGGAVPTPAMVTAHRLWAIQFFDTPESSRAAPARYSYEPIDLDKFTNAS